MLAMVDVMVDAVAEGLWAALYPAAFILAIYTIHRFIRFLAPDGVTDMTTDAAERAATREMADARPHAPPDATGATRATPSMGGGLGGAGLSLVFLEDHGDDVPDDGISRIPVADAVQDEPCDGPEIL